MHRVLTIASKFLSLAILFAIVGCAEESVRREAPKQLEGTRVVIPDTRDAETKARVYAEYERRQGILVGKRSEVYELLAQDRSQEALELLDATQQSLGLTREQLGAELPDEVALVLIHNGQGDLAYEIVTASSGGSSVRKAVRAFAACSADGRFEDAKREFDPAELTTYFPEGAAGAGYEPDDSSPSQLKADVLLLMGTKMYFLRRSSLARKYLEESFELDDDEPLTVYMLGRCALAKESPEEALEYMRAVEPYLSGAMAIGCRSTQKLAHDAIRKKRRAGG